MVNHLWFKSGFYNRFLINDIIVYVRLYTKKFKTKHLVVEITAKDLVIVLKEQKQTLPWSKTEINNIYSTQVVRICVFWE